MDADQGARIIAGAISTPLLRPCGPTEHIGEWLMGAMNTTSLSSGEVIMLKAAAALWNGNPSLALSELGMVDPRMRQLVMVVWLVTYGYVEGAFQQACLDQLDVLIGTEIV